ncbi:hypothetical protein C8R45DRAFT_931335 [Mycena sanguinolenta]|nr:hypothetical protein C8R45DRAFT_931335 [Mycena sanguinolenta]
MASQDRLPTFPSSSRFDGHVRIDKAIFGVHCGDPELFLNMPTPEQAPAHGIIEWDAEFERISWTFVQTPYLLFVPRENPFHGPLLGQLRRPRNRFPLLKEPEGWILAWDVRLSWSKLESGLRLLQQILLEIGGFNVPEGMLRFLPAFESVWPKRFGYAVHFRDRKLAHKVAERSRNAFVPLMSSITLMLFVLDSHGQDGWRDKVLEKLAFENSDQWFADLEASVVGNRNFPRVGGILDFTDAYDGSVSQPRNQHKLDLVVDVIYHQDLPVPLYFHWGEIDTEPSYPMPFHLRQAGFYPDGQEIAYLRRLPGKVSFSPWREHPGGKMRSLRDSHPYVPNHPDNPAAVCHTSTEQLPRPADADAQRFPQPEKHSGQLPGVNIYAFLARRQSRNSQLAEVESPKAKTQRLQREAHAATGEPPGKKGAHVFIWEEESGFLIRRSITQAEAADIWDCFGPNQRRYDSFNNEWDLCDELAPNEGPQDDDSDGDFCQADEHPTQLYPEEAPGPLLSSEDIMRSHGVERDLESGEIFEENPPPDHSDYDIAHIPYARFGFTKPIAPASYDLKLLDSKLCLKCLGDDKWPQLKHNKYQHLDSLLTFLSAAQSLCDIPRELLDLRQQEADIRPESNWAVAVTAEHLKSAERPNGQLFYVLRPRGVRSDNRLIHILLPSAANTLQIVRMGWGPDPQDIIEQLLEYGLEFRICIRDRLYDPPQLPPADGYTGLGYRREGYKPTVLDFGVYETLRRQFISSPRGRAALFAGGIIGRLAREDVPQARACLGPSSEVFYTGARFWDGHSQTAYWDDALTDQEIDLICGVYEIATGRVSKIDDEKQTTRVSWWPKPHAFELSGLNTGWWSPDCERWFQQRLAVIKSGTAHLHKQADWKRFLKFYKKSREVAEINEKIAAEYLNSRHA